ncbi:MAG: amino acid permease, partial [Kofleriaceae bacterium]|nr:amino acid permease [Kofleriaceae bacterium]
HELKRSLSLTDVVALGINGVVGTGIFLLPGIAAGMMGPASILTLLFAGLLSFLIALCFAEVGSQFRGTGGAYLYALRVHGETSGFFVGWMVLVVTISSWAAMVNGLADTVAANYLPSIASGPERVVAILGFMAVLTAINLRGAKVGALVSNLFTAAKLIPIAVFIGWGVFYIDFSHFTPFAPMGFGGDFFSASLIILYAFVGFEALVVPAGEMSNPRRAVPLALVSVLGLVSIVYVGVMLVAIGTLPDIAGHPNPVVASAKTFMGSSGAAFISVGIIISMIGVNSAQALIGPRRVFALAKQGHMPKVLAKVSDNGVPHVALITLFFICGGIAAFYGDFKTLALVSVVGRFAQYISTCLAVIVLRYRQCKNMSAKVVRESEDEQRFTLPWSWSIPVLALGLCGWLLVKAALKDEKPFIAGGIALAAGFPVYLFIRWQRARASSGSRK